MKNGMDLLSDQTNNNNSIMVTVVARHALSLESSLILVQERRVEEGSAISIHSTHSMRKQQGMQNLREHAVVKQQALFAMSQIPQKGKVAVTILICCSFFFLTEKV